jgi:hypothetical protein
VNQTQAPGDTVTKVSPERSRGRPAIFKCGSPVPPRIRAGETHRVSPAPAERRGKDHRSLRNEGQHPSLRVRKRPHGRGVRWPGALAPGGRGATLRRGKGDGLCQGEGGRHGTTFRPVAGRGKDTHCVSPASAERRGRKRLTSYNDGRRPTRRGRSARWWRGVRWPRALATGWRGATLRLAKGDGLCHGGGGQARGYRSPRLRAGPRKRTAFPPPLRDGAAKTVSPSATKGQRLPRRARSARHGRGGRWPGPLAPGWRRGSVAAWQRRWPLPWGRGKAGLQLPHPLRTRTRKRTAFPPPLRNGVARTLSPSATKASTRPGGCEAPPWSGRALVSMIFAGPVV